MNHLSLSFYKPGSVSFMEMGIFKGYLLDTHVHDHVHNKPLTESISKKLHTCKRLSLLLMMFILLCCKSYINLQKEARRMFFSFKLFLGFLKPVTLSNVL